MKLIKRTEGRDVSCNDTEESKVSADELLMELSERREDER